MEREGQIKFNIEHECQDISLLATLQNSDIMEKFTQLDALRTELFEANYIGLNSDGIGFGNISMRLEDGFLISASGTGGARELGLSGYSFVAKADIEANTVHSFGALKASSESMSHAAIYKASDNVSCVVHIHSDFLYHTLIEKDVPASPKDAAYGTVELAKSIFELVKKSPLEGTLVMLGHEDGILFYGHSIQSLRLYIAFIISECSAKKSKCHSCKQGNV